LLFICPRDITAVKLRPALRSGITGCGQQATAGMTVELRFSRTVARRGGVLIKYIDNSLIMDEYYSHSVAMNSEIIALSGGCRRQMRFLIAEDFFIFK
jgi:hypothetical protein